MPDMLGGFGEYTYVPEEAFIFRVPDSLPTDAAVLVEPMSIALGTIERAMLGGEPEACDEVNKLARTGQTSKDGKFKVKKIPNHFTNVSE